MQRFIGHTLLALAALCLCVTAQAQKIAIANAAKIFQEVQEVKDLRTKLEAQKKKLDDEKLLRQQKLRELQNTRDALKADSPAFAEKNRELMQGAVEYQVWERMATADSDREQKQQMLSIYNRITTTIQEVAASKQIDIVLAEQRPELPDAAALEQVNLDQLRALIISRNVLFASGSVDVTNDVVAAMDAKYKSGK